MKRVFNFPGLILLIFSFNFFNSCKKDKPALAVVTTTSVTEISYSSAISGGNVSDEGGSQVAARGICWSISEKPTTSDKITIEGGSSGAFSSKLTDLNSNTLYHVRAYATNIAGTAYGTEVTFTTGLIAVPGAIVTDFDGNDYNTVILGTQTWMTENLKVLHYNNGDPIPNVADNTQWSNLAEGAFCWYSNDEAQYKNIYGAMYNYYAVADARNICPANWRIPSQSDWITLQSYLGGNAVAGGKLKEAGNLHWYDPNDGATDDSKFIALPGGDRVPGGQFEMVRQMGEFWTSTEGSASTAWSYFLGFEAGGLYNNPFDKKYGLSVRCIK